MLPPVSEYSWHYAGRVYYFPAASESPGTFAVLRQKYPGDRAGNRIWNEQLFLQNVSGASPYDTEPVPEDGAVTARR